LLVVLVPRAHALASFPVQPDSKLQLDLIGLDDTYGYSHIELHLQFVMDLYPYYPPLVAVVRPRFEGFISGRIATLRCLQLSHWNPISSVLEVLENIRRELECNGRVDYESPFNCLRLHPEGSYSRLEHLFLKLGIVTEVAPRIQIKAEAREAAALAAAAASSSSSSSKRKHGRGAEGEDSDSSVKSKKIEGQPPAPTAAAAAAAAAAGGGAGGVPNTAEGALAIATGEKTYWAKVSGPTRHGFVAATR